MLIRKIVAGFVVFGFAAGASGQGSFDFGDIPGIEQQPKVDINLTPLMIGFLSNITREADPEAANMLSGLHGVRLRVYDGVKSPARVDSFIDDVTKKLEKDGWQRMVYVQDDKSKVRIHLQMTEQEVSGMTVMVFDGDEAIFINIVGSVSAADLGKVLAALPPVGDVLGPLGLQLPKPAPKPSTPPPPPDE
jgi:Domain of unknown function (DUF4252)